MVFLTIFFNMSTKGIDPKEFFMMTKTMYRFHGRGRGITK